jgi:hypothetical protein
MHSNDVRFYKYMSPESAIASLESGAMKWSIPKLLNDPFEFSVSMDFQFTGKEIANALTKNFLSQWLNAWFPKLHDWFLEFDQSR